LKLFVEGSGEFGKLIIRIDSSVSLSRAIKDSTKGLKYTN